MGYWLKRFTNGSELLGLDTDKTASWSRSKLSDMVGAKLCRDNQLLYIYGPGEYWYSDTFTCLVKCPTPKLFSTRLQKQILSTDDFYCFRFRDNEAKIQINYFSVDMGDWIYRDISPIDVGKWLTLECNLDTKERRVYIADTKI